MVHDKMTHEKMTKHEKSRLMIDLFHRLVMHHALWFNEIKHQMGSKLAMETLWNVSEKSFEIQMKRFAKQFGDRMEDKLPAPFIEPG